MRGSAFIAFFGISVAISGSLVGCGDDDEDEDEVAAPDVIKSGEGESCVTTNDCAEGLACYGNVCLDGPNGTGGTNGSGGSSTGGRGGTNPTLGAENESCTRRADCAPPLGCFNQRCASSGTGEGGGGNVPTRGQPGETCVLTSDCDTGLVCRPGGMIGTLGTVGVCTVADSMTEPSGMTCGAECTDADDCCELPINLHSALGVTSCAELEDLLGTATCDATTPANLEPLCMARDAYCECADDAWDCTDGLCSYVAECAADGMVPGGCPASSRTGRTLPQTCDTADTNTCMSAPLCEVDADCDGMPVSDATGLYPDVCNGGECTCFESRCLRMCDETLDCAPMFDCDSGDNVCVPMDMCSSDDHCQRLLRDVRAVCVESACSVPCATDLDCNTDLTGSFVAVCDVDNMCKPLGCLRDEECPAAVNGARTFCTEAASGAAPLARSAITD